jgi:hypothetical protein
MGAWKRGRATARPRGGTHGRPMALATTQETGNEELTWGMEEGCMQVGEKGACEGTGNGSKGHRDMRMEARESRRPPTMKDAQLSRAVNAIEERTNDRRGPSRIPMDQGMTRIKVHATEEHRDGRMEARERRHSSMKDAQTSGEQAEAVE